jgi:DNA-directed RNA polymerase
MNKIIRNEFVKLYSVDQLELFRQSLAEYTDIDVNLLPEVPKKSGLDLKEIKQSKYFFS